MHNLVFRTKVLHTITKFIEIFLHLAFYRHTILIRRVIAATLNHELEHLVVGFFVDRVRIPGAHPSDNMLPTFLLSFSFP